MKVNIFIKLFSCLFLFFVAEGSVAQTGVPVCSSESFRPEMRNGDYMCVFRECLGDDPRHFLPIGESVFC